jgi:hypothetical protein
MVKTSSFFSTLALGSLCAVLIAGYFYLPTAALAADSNSTHATTASTDCFPQFHSPVLYNYGMWTSVALHPSGLALEVHEENDTSGLLYRVGKLSGPNMVWGETKNTGANGYHPAVAITKEGYVIVVHSNKNEYSGSEQYYRVGKVDPNGSENQSIVWLTDYIHWDGGFRTSIALNDNGVIVGVHESNGGSAHTMYYRVGHLRNPAGGDYTIHWDSGPWSVEYDHGIVPHIAINNHNQVVEVHQVPGETLLHYRRGSVSGGTIIFGESRRYDNYADNPAVALLDSGLVLEVHSLGGLISRPGRLSLTDPQAIEWGDPVKVTENGNTKSPALATNGTYAVVTHSESYKFYRPLFYTVTKICAPYTNGTLVKGSSDKVYVVLNDYRYWIPDDVTFGAMGYEWNNVRLIPDNDLNMIPEGGKFPSVPLLFPPLKYPNGTVLKGSGDKVYVVLNNYRFWIPDQQTFAAMGYNWSKLRQVSDNELNAIPERAPFPSVVR